MFSVEEITDHFISNWRRKGDGEKFMIAKNMMNHPKREYVRVRVTWRPVKQEVIIRIQFRIPLISITF